MGAIRGQPASCLLADPLNEERGGPLPGVASHPEASLIAVGSVTLVNGLCHGSAPDLFTSPEIDTANQLETKVTERWSPSMVYRKT